MSYDLKSKLIQLSDEVKAIIESQSGVEVISTPDYGWENYCYKSPKFRLVHVERYFNDGLLVLHITVFPSKEYKAPIFGLDVVGSEKNGKISVVFLDWSPVIDDCAWNDRSEWKNGRKLPIWGDIFSHDLVAFRPNENEQDAFFAFARSSFWLYLNNWKVRESDYMVRDDTEMVEVIAAQNRYCEQQAKNERTFNVLKAKIGADAAKQFMDQVLFPKIAI